MCHSADISDDVVKNVSEGQCVCVSVCVCVGVCMHSIVPRASLSPVFDCMLQAIKSWGRGSPGNKAMHVCVCMCIAQVCTVMCTVVCAACPASFGIHAPLLTTYLPSQSSSFSFGNIHECSISA